MSKDRTIAVPAAASAPPGRIVWGQVTLASVLMLATLPGRTQGLGLITEPLLLDTRLDRLTYAAINLWATLLGALASLPAGWVLDRFGLRIPTITVVALLGATAAGMSVHPGGTILLFIFVLLTRALGQSALSVASITVAGRNAGPRSGVAMGYYSILFCVFMSAAFVGVTQVVKQFGWRAAWGGIGVVWLIGIVPLMAGTLRNTAKTAAFDETADAGGYSLGEALRRPAFWVFGSGIALFNTAFSGMGLFNQSLLAERGFDPGTGGFSSPSQP